MGSCLASSFCNKNRRNSDDVTTMSRLERCCSGRRAMVGTVAMTVASSSIANGGDGSSLDGSGGVVTLSAQSLNNHLTTLDLDVSNNTSVDINNNISSGRNSTRSNRVVARSNSVNSPPPPTSNNNNNYQHLFSLNNPYSYYVPPTGKSKKLKKDYSKYLKCEKRWGEQQLKAKRDEFWDTAPAFEGKPEIWSALQAAVESLEARNFELAQAIVDSANIIVPSGLLTDCYDELGNRYQIPVYVLVKPSHLIKKAQLKQKKMIKKKKRPWDRSAAAAAPKNGTSGEDDNNNNSENDDVDVDELTSDRLDNDDDDYFYDDYFDHDHYYDESSHHHHHQQQKKSKKSKGKSSSSGAKTTTSEEAARPVEQIVEEAVVIKCRVSTLNEEVNSDLKVSVMPSQTVLSLKQQLQDMTNIQVSQQRLFFGGKMMRDKDRLRVHRLKKNVVVQVVVRPGKDAVTTTVVNNNKTDDINHQAATTDNSSPSPAAVESTIIVAANNSSPVVVN